MRFAIALLALLVAACSRPVPEGMTLLTYATPYAPSHPFSRADIRWMEYVHKQSGGTLRIRPLWSGAVLSSDMSMEELRHGVADIGLVTPIYVRGGTHLIRTQSGFYSGVSGFENQVALYRCLERTLPQIGRELAGLRVLAVQGGDNPGIITRDRPVERIEQLRGMRIRAPVELLSLLETLGADPVNLPMGEVYSAMAKGVIDGVIAPPDTFRAMHFADVANFYTALTVPRGAYPARAMSEQAWDGLSEEHRDLLLRSTRVWEAALAAEIALAAQSGMEEALANGVTVFAVPAEEQRRFDALYLRQAAASAAELAAFGIDGEQAFKTARASITRDGISCSRGI
ncbi:TRAP transporter substrate-binding protein DctP [Pelagerythrobacter marensis]|uniref:TRAP transporter substrate-binding protein DctP n=1 Tax=Pelagerythrobacter marensis TaxID=543877 RepID=A0ABZ2DAX7_9SPHN